MDDPLKSLKTHEKVKRDSAERGLISVKRDITDRYLTNIFTVVLRDCVCMFVSLSPPKPLDQSKNVTVRTFHTWPGSVHEHIFLALGGARGPRRHVAKPGEAVTTILDPDIFLSMRS